MAKTNIKATFDTLDSYFLNTGNMKLNKDYFLDSIYAEIDVTFRNDKQMREYIKNTRKITTIIWTAFISMTNDSMKWKLKIMLVITIQRTETLMEHIVKLRKLM